MDIVYDNSTGLDMHDDWVSNEKRGEGKDFEVSYHYRKTEIRWRRRMGRRSRGICRSHKQDQPSRKQERID